MCREYSTNTHKHPHHREMQQRTSFINDRHHRTSQTVTHWSNEHAILDFIQLFSQYHSKMYVIIAEMISCDESWIGLLLFNFVLMVSDSAKWFAWWEMGMIWCCQSMDESNLVSRVWYAHGLDVKLWAPNLLK